MADPLGNILIEGNSVAEASAAGMRRGGEKAIVRRMSAVHVWMRHPAKDGKIVAVLFQNFQIRRERIIASGFLGKELFGQQAEVVADGQHPARFAARRGAGGTFSNGGKGGEHRMKQWKGDKNAGAAQGIPARV